MNKYLLLRDNKQTGPYSVEELISKGLKPYDLVWLDGKSAAWRYPSEIEELKAFAPAVEEQPYDRFYKKKPDHQVATQQTLSNISQQETTQTQTVEVTTPVTVTVNTPQNITAKKIYVTLPAGVTNRSNIITTTNAGKTEEASAASGLNEKFARLREEKMKQAEDMAANPVISNKATTGHTETPAIVFSEIVEKHHPQQEEKLAPVTAHKSSSSSKWFLRSIAAACLVLGGIIIGLVISNSRQQKDNAALDQVVKQIQEREKRNQLAAQVVPPAQNNLPASDNTTTGQQGPATTPDNNKHDLAGKPANTQLKTATPPVKESLPTKDEQQQTVKIIPAVVTSKPEEKQVDRQAMERARQNIHQLVAVDANKYKTGVLGGISDLKLTVSNNSPYTLDEVEVEIRYLGPEKRVVKTQMLLFNGVAAGEQKTIEAPRTNRGVTIDYVITRINSKALGLAHVGY